MASTINATPTSSGLISSADNSGVLALQTGGTTAITIDGSQKVTINNVTVGGIAGTGTANTVLGNGALQNNTTASNNTAVGYQAGYSNTTGTGYNTFVGNTAGFGNTTGALNTYLGQAAAYYGTTGTGNTVAGANAANGASFSGSYNAFYGYGAGSAMTTGSKNSIFGTYNGNQGGLDIRTANNYIVLSDGDGNPRQIIDSSGNLSVGATSQISPSRIWSQGDFTVINGSGFNSTAASGTATFAYFLYNGTGVGTIRSTGTSTTYNTSSDYRLKENVQPMQNALNVVQQLKPVTYNWKVDGSSGQGFIAHELQAVVPDCVTGEKDAVETVDDVDAQGKVIGTKEVPRYQGIDTSFLVATLTAAIQEQQALITDLTTRLVALENT